MKHGEERNRHIKKEIHDIDIVTAQGKKMNIEYIGSELEVAEKYCAECGEWVSTEAMGIFGFAWCPKCMTRW